LISKRIVENVIVKFIEPILTIIPNQTHFELAEFAEQIFTLLNSEAELKLKYYIESCYQQVEDQSPKAKNDNRQYVIKLPNPSSIDKLATIQSESKVDLKSVTSIRLRQNNEPQTTQEKQKTRYTIQDTSIVEGLTEPRVHTTRMNLLNLKSNNEIDREQRSNQDVSLEDPAERRDTVNNNLHLTAAAASTKGILKPIPLSGLEDESRNEFRRTLKEFSRPNYDGFSQNNLTERKTTGGTPSHQEILPDYLNSCFIMETFLHNYLYEKSQYVGIRNTLGSGPRNLDEIIHSRATLSPEKNTSMTRENQVDSPLMRSSNHSSEMRDSIGQSKRRTKMGGSSKKNTYYDLRNELVDFENFDSDALVFKKKDTKPKKRDSCACGVSNCSIM